jgi:cytoskeletal protein CcmA (bactofilin family)
MGIWMKKKSNSNHGVTSIIDHGCEAQGRLNFIGTVAMNGKFHGELFAADTLLLGKEGEVQAEVQVAVGIISGLVRGNITGRERIELGRTARIFGNIETPVLVLEEGAVFDGQCKTSRQEVQKHE